MQIDEASTSRSPCGSPHTPSRAPLLDSPRTPMAPAHTKRPPPSLTTQCNTALATTCGIEGLVLELRSVDLSFIDDLEAMMGLVGARNMRCNFPLLNIRPVPVPQEDRLL